MSHNQRIVQCPWTGKDGENVSDFDWQILAQEVAKEHDSCANDFIRVDQTIVDLPLSLYIAIRISPFDNKIDRVNSIRDSVESSIQTT